MSITKKSDVKNHLSPSDRTQIHLCQQNSQLDAAGFSASEPDAIQVNRLNFAEDFIAEHSFCGAPLAPGDPSIGSIDPQARATSKSVQP